MYKRTKSYAVGGKKKGMKSKGFVKGGKVKTKGLAKGGAQTTKGYKKGGKVGKS